MEKGKAQKYLHRTKNFHPQNKILIHDKKYCAVLKEKREKKTWNEEI